MRLRYTAGLNARRSRILIDRRVQFRFILLALLCLSLAGCKSWSLSRPSDETSPDVTAGELDAGSLSTAIGLLQDGEEGRAERLLERIVEERSDDVTARLLLAQIRQPPEELLGREFEEVEVRAGESLSVIAERRIGNGLLFYSLAKLNNVEVPRMLDRGQRIKVPKITGSDLAASAEEPADEDESARKDSDTDPNQAAEGLVERGEHARAYSLLLTTARGGDLNDSGRTALARAAVALAREACREDDFESAGKYLRQASPWLGDLPDQGDFARQRAHVEARVKLGEAERYLARGDEAAAFQALMAVREQPVDLTRSHGSKLTRLESALAEYYHDRALSAWRDQQVGRSVELWSRVVDIDPDFEPAIRYLDRARRAQRKLESLENG